MNSGSLAHLSFSLRENYLQLDLCQVTDPKLDNKDVEMADQNYQISNFQEPVLLERNEILKLNNLSINRMYTQAIEKIVINGENDTISMLDFCSELSPLALQFLKQGFSHATVVARKELHQDILRVATNNDIDLKKLSVHDNNQNVTGVHNLLVCDLIEVCGALKQQILEDIALLRSV